MLEICYWYSNSSSLSLAGTSYHLHHKVFIVA
nr:MAG TPA: hypothetical protein [Crassvirales sp.]